MKVVFLGFLIICSNLIVQAQPNLDLLDSLLTHYESNDRYMGGIAVAQDGEVIYSRELGFESVQKEIRASDRTVYRIGSITKTYTATMVFRFMEEGKLRLEDPLSKFYPDIANANQITIGHMLRHQSGIHNFTNDADYITYMSFKKSQADLLTIFNKLPSDFEPGSDMEYSNTAFVLLGWIIEQVSGMSYSDFLEQEILSKLKLQHTYYQKLEDGSNDVAAGSYTKPGDRWINSTVTHLSIPAGAGAIISTASDVALFLDGLMTGQIISEASLQEMMKVEYGMGCGLFPFPFGTREFFGHNGGIDGFSSTSGYYDKDEISFAILGNGVQTTTNDMAIGVLSCVFDTDFEFPSFVVVEVPTSVLERYVGTYSATGFPLDIAITSDGTQLYGQATGQGRFPLSATSKSTFTFSASGIQIEFTVNEVGDYDMNFSQGGMDVVFEKEGGE
ncbi:MAG: serine hydrolase [Bacteroidota bacterium]